MTLLLNHTFDTSFTGDWPGWESQFTGYGGATRSVGLGRGHLGLPEGVANYGAGRSQRFVDPSGLTVNGTASADLYLPASTYEMGSVFYVRDSGTLHRACYGVANILNGSEWYVWRWDDTAGADGKGARTTLGQFTKATPGGKGWGIKVYAVGSDLKVRVWDLSGTEPATWDYSAPAGVVPGYVPTGKGLRCSVESGPLAVPAGGLGHSWDNIRFEDTATGALGTPGSWSAVKVAGAAQIQCSWSAVTGATSYNVEIQRWTGTAWVAHATLTGLTVTSVTLTSTVGNIAATATYRVRCTPVA